MLTDKAGSGESQAGGGTGGGGKNQNSGQAPAGQTASSKAPAAEAHDGIAHSLRKVYQSTVDEPVPDSIADLLSRLS